jgi:dihydrolipoamide dehydrogenase
MSDRYDMAVIGAGPGGYVAAIRGAQLGLKVAVIEKEAVGGLCLNWGCIPSKALLYGAELLNLYRHGAEFGIQTGEITADLSVSVQRSRDIVAKFVTGVETLLAQNGVDVLRGTGRIEGPGVVRLEPTGELIEAANIVIATGARPRLLPGIEVDGERVLTSRNALARREVPRSIIVIGGGAIGVEFGYLYRSYGAEVTIVETLPHLLPNEDEDVSRQLERSFQSQGISIVTGASVQSSRMDADVVTVTVDSGNRRRELAAECVLVGAGFVPDTSSLGVSEAGVKLDSRGWVEVDAYCQTNVPGIWAVGDITGKLLLAHVASHQGETVAEKIGGLEPAPLDYDSMPRAVYCQPQVASLGITEAQARERGIDVLTSRFPFRASGKAMAIGETEGFVKLVVDRATQAVLGYHIVGHGATEMLGEATLGAALETTSTEIGVAVHAHPTLSEALKEAALSIKGEAIHFYSRRTG